jgi:integrase
MTIQRFSNSTKDLYVRGVEGLVKYYGQSPDTLTNEQIQTYFVYLIDERKVSWGTCNNYFSAIICFFRHVCNWDETRFKIPPRPQSKKLPVVLSIEEVKRLFAAAANLKHCVLLKTVYSAGLRVSEVVRLQPHHLESHPSRMMIRVEQAKGRKGRKDRYTLLAKTLLPELRAYWSEYRPGKWLFPGQKPDNHLSEAGARAAYYLAKKKPV